jgi:hypothetical protein
MGAQQTENTRQTGLTFISGGDRIYVVVLRAQDFAYRNGIIDTVLNLASLRNSYEFLYLAVPRLLGATIDAAIFRSHGIGLLLFDERRIDEAVAARAVQSTFVQVTSPTGDGSIASELAALKSMYAEMERNLAKLHEDLRKFRDAPNKRETSSELNPEHVTTPPMVPGEPVFALPVFERNGLPSYFSNNPWLDVLSKRGRSENELIAG